MSAALPQARLARPSLSWLSPTLARALLAVGAVLVLAALSYDRLADGERSAYLLELIRAAAVALVLGGFAVAYARADVPAAANAIAALALLFVLMPVAQHAGRLAHRARWGGEFARLDDDFITPAFAESRWTLGGNPVSANLRDGAAVLEPPPGMLAFLEGRLTPAVTSRLGPAWAPRAVEDAPFDEELRWHGAVRLDREYFVVLDWEPLLIQRTGYGLHVAFPDERGSVAGHQVQQALDSRRTWAVRRAQGRLSLEIDGKQVWSAAARPLSLRPRFGESRTDAQHGGRLELEWVRYARRLASAPPPFLT